MADTAGRTTYALTLFLVLLQAFVVDGESKMCPTSDHYVFCEECCEYPLTGCCPAPSADTDTPDGGLSRTDYTLKPDDGLSRTDYTSKPDGGLSRTDYTSKPDDGFLGTDYTSKPDDRHSGTDYSSSYSSSSSTSRVAIGGASSGGFFFFVIIGLILRWSFYRRRTMGTRGTVLTTPVTMIITDGVVNTSEVRPGYASPAPVQHSEPPPAYGDVPTAPSSSDGTEMNGQLSEVVVSDRKNLLPMN